MIRERTVSLVIPVLNEEQGLEKMLPHLPAGIDEVIIVDGGSKDKTVEVAQKYGATVLVQKTKGYGAAYFEGFAAAKGDIIATVDGDATYPLDSIPHMVEWLVDRNYVFVSGSRFPLSNMMSMHQRNFIGNMVVTTLTSFLFKTKVVDVNSGMWVFYKSFLDKAKFISDAWNLSLEIKIEAIIQKGGVFIEYPINYFERLGESKVVRPWRTGFKSLFFLAAKKWQVIGRARRGEI